MMTVQFLEGFALCICVSLHTYFPLMDFTLISQKGLFVYLSTVHVYECWVCVDLCGWPSVYRCMHVMHVLQMCVLARDCEEYVLSVAAGWFQGAMITLSLSGHRIQGLPEEAILGLGQMSLILSLIELVPLCRLHTVLWCGEWKFGCVWTLKVT